MTFGQTLRQLLSISGVKSVQLARELGYDTSYISRWLNDMKMPSLKNNGDLLHKIAEIICAVADEAAREKLRQAYARDVPAENLPDILASALGAAYDSSFPSGGQEQLAPNALYLPGALVIDAEEVFLKALLHSASEGGSGEVNCVSSTPLSLYGSRGAAFRRALSAAAEIEGDLRIVVHQLVNMGDFARNTDSCCAAICTFAYQNPDISYEFYKQEEGGELGLVQFTAVEDHLLFCTVKNPLSAEDNSFICSDHAVLRGGYLSMKNHLQPLPKLVEYYPTSKLQESYFLYNYVMDGGIRYLLNIMHPIYMEDELAKSAMKNYAPDISQADFHIYYNSLCAKARKEVVIFRSALLEYIYSGRIYLFGRQFEMQRADRITHLEQLLENIGQGDCELTILNDTNPLLCFGDMNLSLYLSNNTGFASPGKGSGDFVMCLNSHRAVEYFSRFFEHLQALGPGHTLSGSAAADFIQTGLTLI